MAEAAIHITIIPAVGYIRCSTEKQEYSPDQQKREILSFAEQKGYAIIEWFIDYGISGTTFERPDFKRLERAIENNPPFKAVICYDETRWGRAIDAEENTYQRFRFRLKGVNVVLAKTSVDPTNEMAPVLSALEGVQASSYSKKLSELTLRGAKSNGIYSNGGSPPLGYIRIAVNLRTQTERELKPGEWCVISQEKVKFRIGDPREVEIVKLIFERRSAGIGYKGIAMELNRNNVPSPKRGRRKNVDSYWTNSTIKSIIENPAYYGVRAYDRNSMSKIRARLTGRELKPNVKYPHWVNDPSQWNIAEGAHDPIITKEIWMKANSFREAKDPNAKNYRPRSQYLLTGLVRCSKCGYAFQGWSGRSGKYQYLKYIDGGWQNKRVCSHLSIPKDQLEKFAVESILETISDPMLIEQIILELINLLEGQPQAAEIEKNRLEEALQKTRVKMKNVLDAIEQSGGNETLIARVREIENEQKMLQNSINEIKIEAKQAFTIAEIRALVQNFIANFMTNFDVVSIEERKEMVRKMITKIVVDREANVVRFYVRRIPSILPKLDELLKKEKELTNFVSSSSSGGRT